MVQVILYIAVSSDGFIADKDGGVAWLDEYATSGESYGYHEFYESIDAIAFGKNTYEQVLTFGPWPYPGKKSYIFGKELRATDNKDVAFVTVDIPQFMKDITKIGVKRLWLMGGAKLAESFYNLGYIDEYDIAIMPKALKEGIPLPRAILEGHGMKLVDEIKWPSGVIQKKYKI